MNQHNEADRAGKRKRLIPGTLLFFSCSLSTDNIGDWIYLSMSGNKNVMVKVFAGDENH